MSWGLAVLLVVNVPAAFALLWWFARVDVGDEEGHAYLREVERTYMDTHWWDVASSAPVAGVTPPVVADADDGAVPEVVSPRTNPSWQGGGSQLRDVS